MSSAPLDQRPSESLHRHSSQPRTTSQSPGMVTDKEPNESDQNEVLLSDPQAGELSSRTIPAQSTSAAHPSERDVKRCWICQMDDTEDTSETAAWRSPCPCSLVAHDECLLEWVADGEAPKDGGAASTQQFFCPVCKFEIQIQRPRDPLVEIFDQVQSSAKMLAVPTAISALVGCGYAGLFAYGVNTLYIVFGNDEAVKILVAMRGNALTTTGSRLWSRGALGTVRDIVTGTDPFWPRIDSIGWKQWVGLPLIAPTLVLSRSTLGNYVFPFIVCGYFINNTSNRDIYHWPPSPGLAFATLPYFRTAYNNLYRFTFADLEKRWDLAVQRKPREGETAEQIAQAAVGNEDDNIFGIEIVEEEVDDAGNPVPHADINVIAPPANAQAEGAAEPAQVQGRDREDIFFQRNWSVARLVIKTTGALSFPLISSIMGTILEILLPAKWVGHAPYKGRFTGRGILQEKWGRTMIGGCLFVFLKDAVTLYCKWKKAQNFGKRKIMDYKRPNGRA